METALGQVEVGAGIKAANPVFLTILVRDDDHRDRLEPSVFLDVLDELDSVHPRHVDVAHHQVVVGAADCVPAVNAVNCNVDRVAAVFE